LNKEVLITIQSKGVFNCGIDGYKLEDKDGLKVYEVISIPELSTFKIINFNTKTKRAVIFLQVEGFTSELVEVSYASLIDHATLNNIDVTKSVEAVLISDRVKYRFSKESVRTAITYVILAVLFFLVGRV